MSVCSRSFRIDAGTFNTGKVQRGKMIVQKSPVFHNHQFRMYLMGDLVFGRADGIEEVGFCMGLYRMENREYAGV